MVNIIIRTILVQYYDTASVEKENFFLSEKIIDFALTYNGYEAAGSREKCGEIGKAHKDETLTDLRICLFYEARRNYWSGGYGSNGYDFDDETALYINEVLEKIRHKVKSGDID